MMEIFLVPHFHCDPVWIADQNMYQEGREKLPQMTRHPLGFLDLVKAYLNCCREDSEYAILLSEIDYLKPYWDIYPEDRGFMKYLVSRGRLELGGSYSEPNENSIGEEALVRNILYGRTFHSLQFGANPAVYLPLDVFGHTIQFSQILKKSGFIGCTWSKHVVGFPPVFNHMSLDGTILPHRRVDYGMHPQNVEILLEDLSLRFEELKSMGIDIDLRFIGGDSEPPTEWLTGMSKELCRGKISVILSGPEQYFKSLNNGLESGRYTIPYTSRDMAFYHTGTSLSRIELKIANRIGETKLIKGERFATIAHLFGAEYPYKALDKAWRQLLFNQHHDAITGTSGDKPYMDLMIGYRETLRLSSNVLNGALNYLASLINTKGEGIPIVVFNSLNWRHSNICKVKLPLGKWKIIDSSRKVCHSYSIDRGNITEVLFRGDNIPSLGYKVFFAIPDSEEIDFIRNRRTVIENEFYRIEVDPNRGGRIKSLIYKRDEKEFVKEERGMNEIVLLKEKSDRKEPSWEIFTTGEKLFSGDYLAGVEREKNNLYERLIIKGNLGDICKFKQVITLYKGIERIDFTTDIIDYKKRGNEDDLIAVIFLSNLKEALPTFEDRFGAITRKKSKGYLDFRTWQWRNYSECGVYPAYRWIDLGPSVTLKTGTSSIAIGPTDIIIPHNEGIEDIIPQLMKILANKGITASTMYDDNDKSRRERLMVEDSTLPEFDKDIFNTLRIAIGIPNNLYIEKLLSNLPGNIIKDFKERIDKKGYSMLLLEDQDMPVLIISAKEVSFLFDAFSRIENDLEDRIVELTLEEGYIYKREVPNYGLTLINRGNISNSVESDGTIVMLLQHTAQWSGKHFEFNFIPEEGTHRFVYALYPHRGTWAEAKAYRKGMEFNFGLDSIVTTSHEERLPLSYSFIDFEESDIVLTALKLKGNPLAGPTTNKEEEVIVRVYEPAGKQVSFEVNSSLPILGTFHTDLMENTISPISDFVLTPFAIETYKLLIKKNPVTYSDYDIKIEPHQPVYVRYWRHNSGAAPIGNLPIVVSLRKEEDTITLYVANDLIDKNVSGKVFLNASSGISLSTEKIEFSLPPGEYTKYSISASYSEGTAGVIEATWTYDENTYKDVLIVGEIKPLEVSLVDKEIIISNPNPYEVEGEAIIGGPIELWGEELIDFSIDESPERFNFRCPPYGEYRVKIDYKFLQHWGIVKLAYMGNTVYKQIIY